VVSHTGRHPFGNLNRVLCGSLLEVLVALECYFDLMFSDLYAFGFKNCKTVLFGFQSVGFGFLACVDFYLNFNSLEVLAGVLVVDADVVLALFDILVILDSVIGVQTY
jgi:hypothetical protein